MHILAFAASNHKHSINRMLVQYAVNMVQEEISPQATIELLDLSEYELPLYRQDREEADGIPEKATEFYTKIGAADAVIVSFAEHNGLYNAAYKNLFDWASRIDQAVYQKKPMLAMATSPGGRGGQNVLKIVTDSAPYFGMDIKASFSLPSFYDNFDAEVCNIKDDALRAASIEALQPFIQALKNT